MIQIMSNGVCHLWYMYLSVLLFCPGGSCGNSDHVKWCLSSVVHVPVCVTVLSRGFLQ